MSEQNLTVLKTLVIFMGGALISGVLLLGAGVWMNMQNAAPGATGAGQRGLPANCPGGKVDVKGRGPIIDTSIDGQLLRLAFAHGGGDLEMVHIDICTGKELSNLKITTDVPEAAMPYAPPTLPQTPAPGGGE